MCASYMAQLYLTFFFINPNTKPLFIFLPFPHCHIVLTGGSRPGAPRHRRHHPKTPGGGPAPPISCRVRSAPRCEAHLGANHPHTLSSMSNLAILLEKQGKLEEAGLRVFGVRGDLTGRFTKGIFLFGQGLRPGFSLVNFPILLDYLFWA